MKKTAYRFFGAFLAAQEKWLNRMADNGFRLVRVGKLRYEFEPCAPGAVCYRVEWIGQKSQQGAQDYAAFLRELGYRVWFKNVNLSLSAGKVRLRPWADPGGRIATGSTTFNRELLIVEKESDGQPFALHTTYEDQRQYYRTLRKPYLFSFAVCAAMALWGRIGLFAVFAAVLAVPAVLYSIEEARLKKQSDTEEW